MKTTSLRRSIEPLYLKFRPLKFCVKVDDHEDDDDGYPQNADDTSLPTYSNRFDWVLKKCNFFFLEDFSLSLTFFSF